MSIVMAVIVWLQQNFVVPVMLVFLLTVVATYWPSRREAMQRCARIPFDADR
jgi:cbb3-type cytochrome oxidase subunit 3